MTESDPGGGLRDTSCDRLKRCASRMSAWRRVACAVLDPLLCALVCLLGAVCGQRRVFGAHHLRAAVSRAPSLIPRCWRRYPLFCARYQSPCRDAGIRAQSSGRPMLPMAFAASRTLADEQAEIGRLLCEAFQQAQAGLPEVST